MQIADAKKMVRKGINTPKYRPNKWKHAIKAGCYPYAINLFQDEFFLVGDLIGKRCDSKVSDEQLINTLVEELQEIGYEVFEIDDIEKEINSEELKIYLQRDYYTGYYHFYRQDDDGTWSHKSPNELPIREETVGINCGWCFQLRKKAS